MPESGLELAGPDLRGQLDILRRRWLTVVVVAAAAFGIAIAVTVLRTTVHRAETKLVVTQTGTLTNATFAKTMSELVLSNVVAQNVIQDLRLPISSDALLDKLSVQADVGSTVIVIRADDHSATRALQIVQETALVFTQLVKQRFAEVSTGSSRAPVSPSATVYDPAHSLPGQVSPDRWRDIGIGAAIAVLLGLLAGFVRDRLDRRLRTADAAASAFGLTVLGSPRLGGRQGRLPEGDTDAYAALRAALQLFARQRPLQIVTVASAGLDGAAAPVAIGLAASFVRAGLRAVVVEADLRRPSLAGELGLGSGGPGLLESLHGAAVERNVRSLPLSMGELAILLAGNPATPAEIDLLGSSAASGALDRLVGLYDIVIVAAPPFAAGAEALELGRIADGTLLVARLGRSRDTDAARLRDLLAAVDLVPLGLVLAEGGGSLVSKPGGRLRRAASETA